LILNNIIINKNYKNMLELKKYLNDDVINVIKSFIIFQPQTRKELRLKNNLEKIKEIKNLLYYI